MTAGQAKPTFSSLLSYEIFREVSSWEISAAVGVLAPKSIVRDWSGATAKEVPNVAICHMISIDGVAMAIANMNAPAPSVVFDDGHLINTIAPKTIKQVATNRAHLAVISAQDPLNLRQAILQARSVSLATLALAKILQTDIVKWIDANNTIDAAILEAYMEKASPNDEPTPFWARTLMLLEPNGKSGQPPKTLAGTLGLWAFGLKEIEFEASDIPAPRLATLAFEANKLCLASDPTMKSGSIVKLADQTMKVEEKIKGTFEGKRVIYLSSTQPIEAKKVGFISRLFGGSPDGAAKPFPRYIDEPLDHPGAILYSGYRGLVKNIKAGFAAPIEDSDRTPQQNAQEQFDRARSLTLEGIKSGRLLFH